MTPDKYIIPLETDCSKCEEEISDKWMVEFSGGLPNAPRLLFDIVAAEVSIRPQV